MNKDVTFHYGALANSLEAQANAQGFTLGDKAEKWQKICNSMILIWIYGIVTDSQKDGMIKRFQKQLIKDLKPFEAEDKRLHTDADCNKA